MEVETEPRTITNTGCQSHPLAAGRSDSLVVLLNSAADELWADPVHATALSELQLSEMGGARAGSLWWIGVIARFVREGASPEGGQGVLGGTLRA
jgi:hypothetical protein